MLDSGMYVHAIVRTVLQLSIAAYLIRERKLKIISKRYAKIRRHA